MLRLGIPSLLIFLIAWAALSNRDELALRAQRIYWGWRCATHVIPAGTVLVESDPEKVKELGNLAHVSKLMEKRHWAERNVKLRLKPGVADPNDASHIEFEYVAGDKAEHRGFIDVYLRDDEKLSVEFRDPAAKAAF